MASLNSAGKTFARSLIASGAVDKTSAWSFDSEDGNALLGPKGDDWENYGKHHLGVDGAEPDKTKAHWKYPFAKGGKLYRSGLAAIRQRAAQQGDSAIFAAAGDLLDEIDKPQGRKAASGRAECKIAPFEFKFLDGKADGTFEGYGAVFGNEDDNGDVVAPVAFDKTLAQHKALGTMPKMLLNHGGMAWGTPTAEDMIPIGKWNAMVPDSHGLQTEGRLINLDTESGKRIYGAMKEGELSGLSMGFIARDFTRGTKPNEPRRTLNAVDLREVSPVTFPANTLATVSEIKAAGRDLRILEKALRDAGLSRIEAKALLADGFKAIALRDAAAGDPATALRALEAGIRSLTV